MTEVVGASKIAQKKKSRVRGKGKGQNPEEHQHLGAGKEERTNRETKMD